MQLPVKKSTLNKLITSLKTALVSTIKIQIKLAHDN